MTQNDVELSNGTLAGMSTLRRSGTATIDTVVDWNFLYATLLNSIFYVVFLEIIRISGPVFFSQMNYLSVAAGFGWGMVLFGERYSLYVWGGTALMAMSVLLLTLSARSRTRAEK